MPLDRREWVPGEPGLFVHDFFLDWERADRLRSARRVVMEAWCETADAVSASSSDHGRTRACAWNRVAGLRQNRLEMNRISHPPDRLLMTLP